jgi:hypothetical protein
LFFFFANYKIEWIENNIYVIKVSQAFRLNFEQTAETLLFSLTSEIVFQIQV